LRQKENDAKREYLDKLVEEIKKVTKFDIADEILQDEAEGRKKDFENRLKSNGLDLEQYLTLTGTSQEDLNKQLKEEAEKGLQSFLVMSTVGEKEDIKVTNEDLDFELAKLGEQHQMSIDQVKAALGRQLDQFRSNLLMSRIEDFLYNNNN